MADSETSVLARYSSEGICLLTVYCNLEVLIYYSTVLN